MEVDPTMPSVHEDERFEVGDEPTEPTPGTGWEAADRFFKRDS